MPNRPPKKGKTGQQPTISRGAFERQLQGKDYLGADGESLRDAKRHAEQRTGESLPDIVRLTFLQDQLHQNESEPTNAGIGRNLGKLAGRPDAP